MCCYPMPASTLGFPKGHTANWPTVSAAGSSQRCRSRTSVQASRILPNRTGNIILLFYGPGCVHGGRCHATTGVTHASWQHIYKSHTRTTLCVRTDSSNPCASSSESNNTETHVLLSNLLQHRPGKEEEEVNSFNFS